MLDFLYLGLGLAFFASKILYATAAEAPEVADRGWLLSELAHAVADPPASSSSDEAASGTGVAPGRGEQGGVSAHGGARAVVDKYQPVGEIGRGGMGDVFEMKDVDLNRSVALKRIRKDMLTPRALAMFLQEAQITAQLEHPNIVPVHDSGRTTTGEAYFTMKRLRGLNLRQVILMRAGGDTAVNKRFTRMRLGIVFLEVVRAVAYAHARGVVHCDLKPSNILIGEHGEVVVGDWGLARKDPLPSPVGRSTLGWNTCRGEYARLGRLTSPPR